MEMNGTQPQQNKGLSPLAAAAIGAVFSAIVAIVIAVIPMSQYKEQIARQRQVGKELQSHAATLQQNLQQERERAIMAEKLAQKNQIEAVQAAEMAKKEIQQQQKQQKEIQAQTEKLQLQIARIAITKSREAAQRQDWRQCGALAGKALEILQKNEDRKLKIEALALVKLALRKYSLSWKTRGIYTAPFLAIAAMDCSPDGQTIATAGMDKTLRIWNANSGSLRRTIEHDNSVYHVRFSPDGTTLVSTNENAVHVWDTKSYSRIWTRNYTKPIDIAFHPNGKLLAVAHVGISLVDIAQNSEIKARHHTYGIHTVRFSQDGKIVGFVDKYDNLLLWDFAQDTLLDPFSGHQQVPTAVQFSNDGKTLVTAGDRTIKIWQYTDMKLLREIELGKSSPDINQLIFSPRDQSLVSVTHKAIAQWDMAKGTSKPFGISTHRDSESQRFGPMAFSQDGELVAMANDLDRKIHIWNSREGKSQFPFEGSYVSSLAFSPDSKTLAYCNYSGPNIFLLDLQTGNRPTILEEDERELNYIDFIAADRIISLSQKGEIKLWNTNEQTVMNSFATKKYMRKGEISPDGKTLACVASDGEVLLWDIPSWQISRTLTTYSPIKNICFHPQDNVLVAVLGDACLQLWDLGEGKMTKQVEGHPQGNALAFCQGSQFAVAQGEHVKFWDFASGEHLGTLRVEIPAQETIDHLLLSPDGNTLAVAMRTKENFAPAAAVQLWDLKQRELKATLPHVSRIRSMAFAAGGEHLYTTSPNDYVKLWHVNGQLLAPLGHTAWIRHLLFTSDGKTLVSGAEDNSIKVWDLNGDIRSTIYRYGWEVSSLALSPDDQTLAVGCGDNTVRLCGITTGETTRTLAGHSGNVNGVRFSPDGKTLASISTDKTAKLWDTASGTLLLTLTEHKETIADAQFSPDGKLLATACFDDTVKLWNVGSDKSIATLPHPHSVLALSFHPQGKILATACLDGNIRLWDIATAKNIATLAHGSMLNSIAFSPDGAILASADGKFLDSDKATDKKVKMWNMQSLQIVQTFDSHNASIESLAFSPNGDFFAFADRSAIRFHNIATLRTTHTLPAPKGGGIPFLGYAQQDGKTLIATGREDGIVFYDANSGERLPIAVPPIKEAEQIAVSKRGDILAIATQDDSIILWDIQQGKAMHTLVGHQGRITSLCFSLDDTQLLSADTDHVKLWQVASGEEIVDVANDRFHYQIACFTPGERIALINRDKIRIWSSKSHFLPDIAITLTDARYSPGYAFIAARNGSKLEILRYQDGTYRPFRQIDNGEHVYSMNFSSDEQILATSDGEGFVRFWDLDSGILLLHKKMEKGSIHAITLRPDNRSLAYYSYDGKDIKLCSTTELKPFTIGNPIAKWSTEATRLFLQRQDNSLEVRDLTHGQRFWHHAIPDNIVWHSNVNQAYDGLRRDIPGVVIATALEKNPCLFMRTLFEYDIHEDLSVTPYYSYDLWDLYSSKQGK